MKKYRVTDKKTGNITCFGGISKKEFSAEELFEMAERHFRFVHNCTLEKDNSEIVELVKGTKEYESFIPVDYYNYLFAKEIKELYSVFIDNFPNLSKEKQEKYKSLMPDE